VKIKKFPALLFSKFTFPKSFLSKKQGIPDTPSLKVFLTNFSFNCNAFYYSMESIMGLTNALPSAGCLCQNSF
jgi:hypothetical protein